MDKDLKKKLGAEKLEKREAPFMPISYQDDTEGSGGGGGTERSVGSRGLPEDLRSGGDGGGDIDRPRVDRNQD